MPNLRSHFRIEPYRRTAKRVVKASLSASRAAGVAALSYGAKKIQGLYNKYTQKSTRRGNHSSGKDTLATKGFTSTYGKKVPFNKKFAAKVREAASPIDTLVVTTPAQLTAAIGTCGYLVGLQTYTPTDLSAIAQNIAGSVIPSERYQIRDVMMTSQITNMSNAAAYMRVYECEARDNVPYITTNSMTSIQAYLSQGWTDSGSGPTTFGNDIAGTLFSSSTFVSWYKINKVRQFEFQAGESKRINLCERSPRYINMSHVFPASNVNTLVSLKKSKFFVFQQWGCTVQDGTTNTLVSTNRTEFDFIHEIRYNYQYLRDFTSTIYRVKQLGAVTNPKFTAEDIDLAQTEAAAS